MGRGGEGLQAGAAAGGWRGVLPLRVRDVQLYYLCESLTEVLIYVMVIFSPWAFGTTEEWSMRTMNAGGYTLGGLLAVKLGIRWLKGYRPLRWDWERRDAAHGHSGESGSSWLNPITVLAALSVAIVAYCWLSAWNARASIEPETLGFAYRANYIAWLPHSMDSSRSWPAFWKYLALACSFWTILDWLPGKTASEQLGEGQSSGRHRSGSGSGPLFPARLRRLLWVLAINGGLLGLEGIVQRLEGSGLLLFMVRPREHMTAQAQFGPYAYRSNAAQYFNLLWPVCVGFWWTLNRGSGFRRAGHHWVLVCALIMAACPIISTSRAGAMVAVGLVVLALLGLLTIEWLDGRRKGKRHGQRATLALLSFAVVALGLGFALGWKALKPRLAQMREDYGLREEMYESARPMAADYPVFGTGPGTFGTVYWFYRRSPDEVYYEQLHNDWLETRITFGWVGSILIGLALLTVVRRWFGRGGIHGGRRFMLLMWLSLAGCLVQARWDFPFQIYSIVFLVLVLCAIMANLTRRA